MKNMQDFLQWFYSLSDLLELWTLATNVVRMIKEKRIEYELDGIIMTDEFVNLENHLDRMANR